MSDLSQQKGIVILQNLKLPESLDFDFLRREGLKHIGNFSGKLWTDHNAHDPGITILEALCYALVDLGYRTQLPVADLLAPPTTENGTEKTKEDNFLTPAEILTINPVTITDFRKLLLEIEGVRNAWLEPLDISAPTLFYRENNCQLECRSTPSNEVLIDGEYRLSPLNGLYRVYIELADSSLLQAVENNCLPAKGKEEAFDAILHEIKATLSAHRNLCEDFEEIVVLCPKEIPFCADIELREGADPDQAFFEIARKLREFFSPSPRFYSLQELLDQGKDIEDIYAGRPYALPDLDTVLPKNASQKKPCQPGIDCKAPEASAKRQSYGFIDTEELEKLERRRAVRLSDLYTVLHGIEAVESVRNLCFKKEGAKCLIDWVETVEEGCIPTFSLEIKQNNSDINLYSKGVKLPYDREAAFRKITEFQKIRLNPQLLDLSIPYGEWRHDLADYTSIQMELPRVYGIGEVGLPDSAGLLRQTQAHQLRAFLLFFDQLLANYLQQLAHLRDLFSFAPESSRQEASKHTLFTKTLDQQAVPELNRLLRFGGNPDVPIIEGEGVLALVNNEQLQEHLCAIKATMNDTLRITTVCEPGVVPNDRELLIALRGFRSNARRSRVEEAARRDFANGEYSKEVVQDFSGYFFVFYPDSLPELAFVSYRHFDNEQAVYEAMNSAAFWATQPENYRKYRSGSHPAWAFNLDIVFRSADYGAYIQQLLENPADYAERRDAILNHLMSRFAERFSEYASIAFGAILKKNTTDDGAITETAPDRTIWYKSRFLENYPSLSRNRGRAFNYQKVSWNSHNISGYEDRVLSLAGMPRRERHTLCNVEVLPCNQLETETVALQLSNGQVVFMSEKPVLSKELAQKQAAALQKALQEGNGISARFDATERKYRLNLTASGFQFVGNEIFDTQSEADHKISLIKNYYAGEYQEVLNLLPDRFEYKQVLLDPQGAQVFEAPATFSDAAEARQASSLKTLRAQANTFLKTRNQEAELIEAEPGILIEAGVWMRRDQYVQEVPPRWNWSFWDADKKQYQDAPEPLADQDSAAAAAYRFLLEKGHVFEAKESACWHMPADGIQWRSAARFKDANRVSAAWKQAKTWSQKPGNYHLKNLEKDLLRLELHNNDGGLLAFTEAFSAKKFDREAALKAVMAQFKGNAKFKTVKTGKAYGFYVFAGSTKPVMESYSLYETLQEAVDELNKAYYSGVLPGAYQNFGDTVNMNLAFILESADKRFLAEKYHELELENEGARTTAIKSVIKALNEHEKPVVLNKLSPTYRFEIPFESEKAKLSGIREYEEKKQAANALETALLAIYRGQMPKDAAWEVPTGGNAQILAENLRQTIDQKTLRLEVKETAVEWKFQTIREPDGLEARTLWRSEKSFTSPDDAKTAYIAFLQESRNLKIESRQGLVLKKGAKTIVNAVSDEAEALRSEWSRFNALKKPVRDELAIWVRPKEENVVVPEQPDESCFVFQFIKKGELVACQPDPNAPPLEHEKPADCGNIPPAQSTETKKPGRKDLLRRWMQSQVLYYLTKDQACEARGVLFSKAFNRKDFPDFCAAQRQAISLLNEDTGLCKYHFVLGSKQYIPANLWVSFVGYDTEKEALTQLDAHFFDLLEAAADPASYSSDGLIRTAFNTKAKPELCRPSETHLAVVSKAVVDAYQSDEKGMIEFLVRIAALYPVFRMNGRYFFQLSDPSAPLIPDADPNKPGTPAAPIWVSKDSYATQEEAMAAFEYFLQLLLYPGNLQITESGNKYRIDVVEVLALSTHKFKSEDLAWGRDLNDKLVCPRADDDQRQKTAPDTACENQYSECEPCGVEEFLFTAQQHGALYPVQEGDRFTYFIVRDCFVLDLITCWYDTPEARDEAMAGAGSWEITAQSSTALTNQLTFNCDDEEPDNPWKCQEKLLIPSVAKKTGFSTETLQKIKADLAVDAIDRAKGVYDCKPLKPPVRNTRYRLMPVEAGPCGPYSYQVVDTCCVLAQSPQCYKDASMRDTAMQRLRDCLADEGFHLLEHILLRPDTCPSQNEERLGQLAIIQRLRGQELVNCMLGGCPDWSCEGINWQPDADEECIKLRKPIRYLPFADPYSFWVTLALPAWMGRFQDEAARDLLEYLLRKEAPAHIALNIKWLSPRQFCDFEQKYQAWLLTNLCPFDEKQRKETSVYCTVDSGQAPSSPLSTACQLVECLQKLKAYQLCDTPPVSAGDCKCLDKTGIIPCDYFSLFDCTCCVPKTKAQDPPGKQALPNPALTDTQATLDAHLNVRRAERIRTAKALFPNLKADHPKFIAINDLIDNFLEGESQPTAYLEFLKELNPETDAEKQLATIATHHLADRVLAIRETSELYSSTDQKKLTDRIKQLKKQGLALEGGGIGKDLLEKFQDKTAQINLYQKLINA